MNFTISAPLFLWLAKLILIPKKQKQKSVCDGKDNYIYTESLYKQLRLYEFNIFVLGKSGQSKGRF